MSPRVILLVEDNRFDEELTVRSLVRSNLANRIVVVRDGAEAIDYLLGTGKHAGRDPQDLPAVILLDLHLPKVDGLEVLQRIRATERLKELPVLVLTSSTQHEESLKRDWPDLRFLRKPVDFESFSRAITDAGMFLMLLGKS